MKQHCIATKYEWFNAIVTGRINYLDVRYDGTFFAPGDTVVLSEQFPSADGESGAVTHRIVTSIECAMPGHVRIIFAPMQSPKV